MPFRSGKSRFWSKPGEGKGEFAATPNLTPVARRVAACGPMCGLAGRRWGTDTSQPIWARVGEFFGAPKAKQEKGIDAFPRQCRLRQPAVRTATGVCGVLRLTLIFSLPICFDAILCKNARQPRVCKAFGTRSAQGRCAHGGKTETLRGHDTRGVQQAARRQRPRGHQHTGHDLAERCDPGGLL